MKARLLILGASSSVGRHLYARLGPERAIATFRSQPVPGGRRFDSVDMSVREVVRPGEATHAAILLADPQPDSCVKDPVASHRLNVEAMERLIEDLWGLGITPVFASTEFVFDGAKGDYAETDPAEPILLYGRQKKEVEDFLAASGRPHVVLRFAKVFGIEPGDGTLFTSWAAQIAGGQTRIRCAADQIFSPIYVGDVGDAIIGGADRGLEGLFHLAGDAGRSRVDLLRATAAALGRPIDIDACSIDDFPLPEKRPHDVSMRNAKLKAALGLSFMAPEEALERIARRLAS